MRITTVRRISQALFLLSYGVAWPPRLESDQGLVIQSHA